MKCILLIDGDSDSSILTKWFLGSFGYVVHCVRGAEEALALFDPRIHDLIVTDHCLAKSTGVGMAQMIKKRSPATPVLLYSAVPSSDLSCVDMVIRRPSHLLELRAGISKLLEANPSLQPEPNSQIECIDGAPRSGRVPKNRRQVL